MPEDWDVVVVGAGTAGCAVAARLADVGRRVLLLEAGPGQDDLPDLHDPRRLPGGVPGHAAVEDFDVELTDGRRVVLQRGRVVGGSSAVNAAAFLRGRPGDYDGWASAGHDRWSYAAVLPAFRRLEADRDFGDDPVHGADGPVTVSRPAVDHPVADAFAAAAEELGVPAEPDKNAGGPPGYGPVPLTVADGLRVDSATAYLSAPRPGLTVRTGVRVRGIVVERGRAVGVRTDTGLVRAREVLLSAGAVGSAHLLLLSGIGPADALRAADIDVVADLPVGEDCSDHPLVYVDWRPARPVPDAALPLSGALHTADLEVLPWLLPFSRLTGAAGGDALAVGIGLMRPDSRGTLTLRNGDPADSPRLRYGYLGGEPDRQHLREGVRLAAELLRTRAFAVLDPQRTGLPDGVLVDDGALDRWIRARLTTAVHLSGTAAMGRVVDQDLRVRGIDGLRVVDTSVLPVVPSRGTAATAFLVGERGADFLTAS